MMDGLNMSCSSVLTEVTLKHTRATRSWFWAWLEAPPGQWEMLVGLL